MTHFLEYDSDRPIDHTKTNENENILDADVGGEFCGEFFGLNDSAPSDVLMASIGRKHCASGLNVLVTSRSADDVSSEWRSCDSEKRICNRYIHRSMINIGSANGFLLLLDTRKELINRFVP